MCCFGTVLPIYHCNKLKNRNKMKKLILLGAVAFIAAFTSCKKDYSCVCTTTETNNGTTITHTETVATYKATHKSAETSCEKNNTNIRTCDLQ